MTQPSCPWRRHARPPSPAILAALVVLSLLAPAPARAGEDASPRAAVSRFIGLAHDQQYAEAATLLELPPDKADAGPTLARRLAVLLERQEWFSLEALSGAATGDLEDKLPPDREEIGTIVGVTGLPEPVILVRLGEGDAARWRFAAGTVTRVDGWYRSLPDRWLVEHMPAPLLRAGPFGLRVWQWLALPVLIALAVLLGVIAARLTHMLLGRVARNTDTQWDDIALERLRGPMRAAWSLGAAYVLLPFLGLIGTAQLFLRRGLRTALFFVFFWALLRGVDMIAQIIFASPWSKERPSSRALISLSARFAKIVVVALAVVAALAEFGFPVASLIAGLGIGGLALALAAQKTVENLFGAVALGIDQPFREGDFVKVEDFVGTVEAVGLRSTRIRTLDRTLISLPNGRLADMRIESFAARDRLRLACVLSLVYGTTQAQLREVLDGWEQALRAHPKIWPDAVVVRFKELAAYSLDIDIMAWFTTSDWGQFQLIRQEILLSFMEVVEKAGTSFAFPTRTLHVQGDRTGEPLTGGRGRPAPSTPPAGPRD